MKSLKKSLFLVLTLLVIGFSGQASADSKLDVKAGLLRCDVAGGVSFIFGSSRDVSCTYENIDKSVEHYTGQIDKYGVDIGYTRSGVMIWVVLAGTEKVPSGALRGEFVGVSADAALGVGLGANVLVLGGNNPKVALQPLSVQGIEGVNIAAGVAALKLTPKK